MESESEYCVGQYPEGCGAKVVEYQHHLNKVLARGLVKLHRAGPGDHHLGDLGLTYSERCNFQKMRYFRLVEPSTDSEGLLIQGHWRITQKGAMFATKKGYCYPGVWTWRGDPVEWIGDPIEITQVLSESWLAEDYARNARLHEEDDDGGQ